MSTMDELRAIANTAIATNNVVMLQRVADDFHALASEEAYALEYHMRGWAAYCVGANAQALEYFQHAVDINTTLGLHGRVASAISNIGVVYVNLGDYAQALEYQLRSVDLHSQLRWPKGVAISTGAIGTVYVKVGDLPRALDYFQRALDIHVELGNSAGAAVVTGNMGSVFQASGDFSQALELYERALEYFTEVGDNLGVEHVTGNIGSVYCDTGDFPTGLAHFRRALDICLQIGAHAGIASVTANIVDALCKSGAVDEARNMLASLDVSTIEDPSTRILCEFQRAFLRESDGDVEAAHTTLQSALQISQQHGIRAQQADAHKRLRDLAQKRNDFAAYIEHNNEFTRITEEINGKETAQRLAMQAAERTLNAERAETAKHMAVLHSTLPKHIADRVARGEVVNDKHDCVAVVFLDLVGFTTMSSSMDATDVVALLERVFALCDVVMNTHGLMKIKTIGDSYMAVAFDNIHNAAHAALELATAITEVPVRIGIHCGTVVAGVLGKERMQYDVWGDTVNIASRMESTSEPGRIHVSTAFAEAIEEKKYGTQNAESNQEIKESQLQFVERGEIAVKGKGMMKTFWLEQHFT
ncbi:hypothetical protein BH10BAC6_BH10BAC6_05780 [soil metagenome]